MPVNNADVADGVHWGCTDSRLYWGCTDSRLYWVALSHDALGLIWQFQVCTGSFIVDMPMHVYGSRGSSGVCDFIFVCVLEYHNHIESSEIIFSLLYYRLT